MALTLNITACLKNCCSELEVTDVSGFYNLLPNPDSGSFTTGWDAADTNAVDPAGITSATIAVTNPSGTTTSTTVTTDVQAYDTTLPYYPTHTISPTGSTFSDGIYTITYTVVDSSITYTKSITQLFYCNAQCCVDTMWSQLPSKACGCDYDDWLERCFKAEGLLRSLRSAAGCGNSTAISTILDSLEEICNFNDCNCT